MPTIRRPAGPAGQAIIDPNFGLSGNARTTMLKTVALNMFGGDRPGLVDILLFKEQVKDTMLAHNLLDIKAINPLMPEWLS